MAKVDLKKFIRVGEQVLTGAKHVDHVRRHAGGAAAKDSTTLDKVIHGGEVVAGITGLLVVARELRAALKPENQEPPQDNG